MKILFVYPNHQSELRIPLAISILIAQIRKLGHEVKLFDTTFMGEFKTDNEAMEKLGTHLHTDFNITSNTLSPKNELNKIISEYRPDFIFVSLVERNFKFCKELLKDIDIPVLIGGILPTIAPNFVSNEQWVDYICVGEGELEIEAFLKNPRNIYPTNLIDLNNIPFQDWSDFDERHLLKPFMGKVYKGGSFEFSRGCLKNCSFCVAPKIRKTLEGLGKYHRFKSPKRCIEEIKEKVDSLEMVSFGDTDFLSGVPKKTIWELLKLYSKEINLPFTIQTGVETLLDPITLYWLREAKCCAISVGIESGSEKIRKSVIHKVIPIDLMKKAFRLCR
jgi:anaerobic magnesium-protoporphyrin IX monomethyl ester cyclase